MTVRYLGLRRMAYTLHRLVQYTLHSLPYTLHSLSYTLHSLGVVTTLRARSLGVTRRLVNTLGIAGRRLVSTFTLGVPNDHPRHQNEPQ